MADAVPCDGVCRSLRVVHRHRHAGRTARQRAQRRHEPEHTEKRQHAQHRITGADVERARDVIRMARNAVVAVRREFGRSGGTRGRKTAQQRCAVTACLIQRCAVRAVRASGKRHEPGHILQRQHLLQRGHLRLETVCHRHVISVEKTCSRDDAACARHFKQVLHLGCLVARADRHDQHTQARCGKQQLQPRQAIGQPQRQHVATLESERAQAVGRGS